MQLEPEWTKTEERPSRKVQCPEPFVDKCISRVRKKHCLMFFFNNGQSSKLFEKKEKEPMVPRLILSLMSSLPQATIPWWEMYPVPKI